MNNLIISSFIAINTALIGGDLPSKEQFRSTVYVERTCTASKIGPKLFLLAAHCIKNGPYKNNVAFIKNIFNHTISFKLKSHFTEDVKVTVDKIYIHPSFEKEILTGNALSSFISFDIAAFSVVEETPEIEIAKILFDEVLSDTEVIIGGYGCEKSVDKTKDFRNARYKIGKTTVLSQKFQLKKSDLMSKAREFNFFTKGQKFDPSSPSLCPGDSGGAVYTLEGDIIGVNSQYTFKPKDPSGISYTNLHTKISAVADWLQKIISENP